MRLRWQDLDLPVMETPEVQRRARVAEFPLIGGETIQQVTGTEARVLACRVVLSGPYRSMIEDLDGVTAPGAEGVLEHPTEGRLRAFIRSCVVIRHADGSADYRLEWAILGAAAPEPVAPAVTRRGALEAYAAATDRVLSDAMRNANPAEALAAIATMNEFISTTRKWAALAMPGAAGRLVQALSDLNAAVEALIFSPFAVAMAWKDLVRVLPIGPLRAIYGSLPAYHPAGAPRAVWSACMGAVVTSLAEAALDSGPPDLAIASRALDAAVWSAAIDPDAYRAMSHYRATWREDEARIRWREHAVERNDSAILVAGRTGLTVEQVLEQVPARNPCWLPEGVVYVRA